MSELENMDIRINLKGDATDAISSVNDTIMSVAEVSNEVEILRSKLSDIRTLLSNSGGSLFERDMMSQVDLAQRTVDKLIGIRQQVDNALGNESKTSNTAFFNHAIRSMQMRVSELNDATHQAQQLKNVVTGLSAASSVQSTNKLYNEIKIGIKKYAESQAAAVGTRGLASYVNGFMRTREFNDIKANNNAAMSFNDAQMKSYLTAAATAAIGTIYRNEYVDWEKERRSVGKVQDMLPKAFANIKLGRNVTATRNANSEDFSRTLTQQELSLLEEIIVGNQYVAREAQAAGIINRRNGRIYMNKNASQGHVNNFAGKIAQLFSAGAMGMPMYGIDDIYDPKHLNSIAAKNNKTISAARRAADELNKNFDWLNPGYYSDIPALPGQGGWYKSAKIRAAGRKDRMQFLEVTPQEINADGTLTFTNGEKRYTPVVQSAYQLHLSKQQGATPFTHNGHNDNEIFLKLPNEDFVNAASNKDEATQEALKKELARVFGTQIINDGRAYSLSGLTKTHAVYTAVDLKDQILKQDPYFFNNGEVNTTFNAANSGSKTPYERFANAVSYNRLQRVEGEDIGELYGVDTKNLKVVVGNLRGLAKEGDLRIDGQNFVSSRILPEGFQGRSHQGKATYTPVNFKALFEKYSNFLDANGNLILPGANIDGTDLIIPPDVDVLEDFQNVKTNKSIYESKLNAGTLTSAEVSADRQQDFAKYGIWAKTTYDAANTGAQFISAQLANTMAFTPEASRYFRNIYAQELAALNDDVLVIEKLFKGDDVLSHDVQRDQGLLHSKEAQRRIQSYRDSLHAHIAKGDLLLPEGEAMYNMISAWAPDVFNDIFVAAGKELTDDQKAMSLKYNPNGRSAEQLSQDVKDQVLSFLNPSETLALGRYPSTINGNVEVVNKAVDESFQSLADALGIDKNALYVDPSSAILTRLQGADEDGDTALVYAIKHSKNEGFKSAMAATLANTAKRYLEIYQKANLSPEELKQITEKQTQSVDPGKSEYSIDNPEDLAFFWGEDQKSVLHMGAASGVTRNAFLRPISSTTSRAMMMAEKDYDINTVRGKKAKVFLTTNDERAVLGEGAPIGSVMNWAMKSRTLGEDGSMVGFNQKMFNDNYAEKIAKSNFASIHSPNDMRQMMSVWYAKNILGEDTSGGFNWDSIFNNLSSPFEDGSAAGDLNKRLNDLRKRYIQGEFLVFSDDLMDELDARSGDVMREITTQVNEDSSIAEQDRFKEIRRRAKLAGVDTVRHINEYGITQKNLKRGAELYAAIEQDVYADSSIADELKEAEITRRVDEAGGHVAAFDMTRSVSQFFGENGMFGQAVEYESTFSAKKQQENEERLKKAQETKTKLEEEKAKKIQEYTDAMEQSTKNEIAQLEEEIQRMKAEDDEAFKNGLTIDPERLSEIEQKEKRLAELKTPERIVSPYDTQIAQQEATIKQAERYQKDAFEFYRDQGEYQRIVGGAEEFLSGLRSSERSKEAFINDLDPATRYLNKQRGIAGYYSKELEQLALNANLGPSQQANISKILENLDKQVIDDFADKGVSETKRLAEALQARQEATSIDYDKSEHEIDGYLKKLKELVSYQEKMLELAKEADTKGNKTQAEQLRASAEETGRNIAAARKTVDVLRTNLYQQDISSEDKMIARLHRFTRDRNRRYSQSQFDRQMLANENDYEQYLQQYDVLSSRLEKWQARRRNMKASGLENTDNYKLATQEIERLSSALAECQREMDQLSGSSGKLNAGLTVAGQAANRVITQFGHRVFNQAINEAKNFVTTYDASMTEIQMVTLKTEDEIEHLGDGLIDKAVDLKAKVSEVTNAATSLYRQGLSDAEVDSRLEDVIKFSKTAKVSATDSIKLATVAMNSGDVKSTDRVFDVVSALGDSAATEAAQITKGLQKSMAAASSVGVTFEDLVAMLTVVTSKTQLSGSVAGTTMRNIMSRMTRFGDQDSRYADQVQLLKNAGVEIFEDGEMRSVTDILSEIGALWEGFDDRTKSDIAYALGGTEQFSNVIALMQGFAETDETGQNLVQKYIAMANASDGITDKKYQHQVESLDGALTNLQTTFDKLVDSAESTGVIVEFIDCIADGVAGFADLNTQTDGWISRIGALSIAIAGLLGLAKTNPYLLAMLGIGGAMLAVGKSYHAYSERNKPQTIYDKRVQSNIGFDAIQKQIDDASEINKKRIDGKEISDEEYDKLVRTLTSLNVSGQLSFDGLTNSAGNAITSIDDLAKSADATSLALSGAATNISEEQKNRNLTLSLSAANAVDDSKTKYSSAKYEHDHSGLNEFMQFAETEDGEQVGRLNLVKYGLEAAKGGQRGTFNTEVYDFAASLAYAGALHGAKLQNGDTVSSLIKDGKYNRTDIVNAMLDEVFSDNAFTDGSLLSVIFEYANGVNSFAAFAEEFKGFGDYNSDNIYQSIIGREDVATSGAANLLHKAIVADVNTRYAKDETFDFSNYIDSIFAEGYRNYLQRQVPEEYTALQKDAETEEILITDPVAKFSKAVDSAKVTHSGADYEDAWIAASDIMRTATGSAAERLRSFAEQVTDEEAGLADWDEMIRAKGSEALVNAWDSLVETDEQGVYRIRKDVTEEEADAFERILAGMSDRTSLMGQYRSAETVAASAQNTFNKLTEEGVDAYEAWQNLFNVDELNKLAQNELIQILGEDLVHQLINGMLDADGIAYAQHKIDAYEAESRVKSGYDQEEVVGIVRGFTGSYSDQMRQYDALQQEHDQYEKALYSYNRLVSGNAEDSDYSQIGSAIGFDEDRVRELSRTEAGKAELNKRLSERIRIFSDTLSKALLALLTDDEIAGLTKDMDIDKLLETFKGNVREDVYAFIETVLRSFDITYDGESFDVDIRADSGIPTPWQLMKDAESNYYATHRNDEMLDYLKTAVTDGGNMGWYLEQNASNEDWSTFFNENPLLAAAFREYGEYNPESGERRLISQENMLNLLNDAKYGGKNGSEFFDFGASVLLGEEYKSGDVDWTSVLEQYGALMNTDFGDALIGSMSANEEFVEIIEMLNDALKDGTINAEDAESALKKYNDAIDSDATAKQLKYNKAMQKTIETLNDIRAGGEDAANAYNDLYKQSQNLANANWALNQYKTGSRSDNVVSILSKQFNIDERDLKEASKQQAELYYSTMSEAYADQASQLTTNLETNINDVLGGYMAQLPEGHDIDLGKFVVGGVVDVSGLTKAFAESDVIVSSAWSSLISALSSLGATFTVGADGNTIQVDTTNVTKKSYGGGGGSKKSSADKLVERLGYGQSLYEHQIKMVQYEQTKYENADELGNYGKMLEEELDIERAYLPVLESNIAALRSELADVKEGSEDWYKLRDAILEAEEQYADINNTIDENEKKLKENQQAILKLHTDLEEMVVGEIELRIEAEKEMLDGSVSMQDIILNAIKQRYQDEWDLIKQDIDKKKEALQQEKDLIDERLDARREAEDEAAKYEELAELKKQLSLISMDSTRTKDAAALRESIAELEKEIGWDIAEKQAENEKNAIQDQIDAYDDYVSKGDEDLNDLLSDANNFAEEVNGVMMLNQTELFDWLKQNVKEYANSLDDAQKQMVQSWEATYKQMLGITDTYWDEVNAILSSKDVFLEYMKQSNEYIYASEDERAQMLYQWEEAYDMWRKAQKNDAEYNHGDSGLGDWSGSEYTGSSSGSSGGSGSGSTSTGTTNTSQAEIQANAKKYYVYDGNGKSSGPYSSFSVAESVARQAADLGNGSYVKDGNGNIISRYTSSGDVIDAVSGADSNSGNISTNNSKLPKTGWPSYLNAASSHGYYYKITENGINVDVSDKAYATRELAAEEAKKVLKSGQKYQTKYFLHGGIADFTGPAWLDGTPTEPERILSADQTRDFETLVQIMSDFRNAGVPMDALRGMARWSSIVNVPSSLSHIGGAAYQGNSANIGDIFVNITEAQISDDRDIEVLANIVGEKFVKEIGKQGFNVSRYNF
jgi:TP901 family phage tail tape measure protein